MLNYKNSMIYQIWSPSNPDLIYIGSTTQSLSRRMVNHRSEYRRYMNGTYHYVSSFQVLACGDARIELIEEVECKDRKELHRIEGKYIRERDCVNKFIAGRTMKEYCQDNKEKRNEHSRQYHKDNKEKRNEYHHQYRKDNKEKIKKTKQQYYQNNKEQLKTKASVKINCECGSTVQKKGLAQHKRSKKHQQYISQQQSKQSE